MARYMIQTSHDPTHADCERIGRSLLQAGAHFVANAEWGCADGNHTAWLIVEAHSDREAWLVIPPAMRGMASVTKLNQFGLEDLVAFSRITTPKAV